MHKKNEGVTTIVVVCVMAVIMTLALGLLLSASVLLNTAQKTAAKEQCRILAVSFSDEVRKELISSEYQYDSQSSETAGRVEKTGASPLWHYIKQSISEGSWPYYNEAEGSLHNKENAWYTFTMQPAGAASQIADTKITLYWEPDSDNKIPARLITRVTVTVKEQSCTITDTYELSANGSQDYSAWNWKHSHRE